MSDIRIKRAPRDRSFTMIDNRTLADSDLKWEVLGVLVYLLSKPDDWEVKTSHLINEREGGRTKMLRILNELKKAGYVVLVFDRDSAGRITGQHYEVFERPVVAADEPVAESETEGPCSRKSGFRTHGTESTVSRQSGEPIVGKPYPLLNTDSLLKTEKDIAAPPPARGPEQDSNPRVQPHIALIDAMVSELGLEVVDYKRHVRDARELVKLGATPETIRETVRWVMGNPERRKFFETAPFSMTTCRKFYEAAMTDRAAARQPIKLGAW